MGNDNCSTFVCGNLLKMSLRIRVASRWRCLHSWHFLRDILLLLFESMYTVEVCQEKCRQLVRKYLTEVILFLNKEFE